MPEQDPEARLKDVEATLVQLQKDQETELQRKTDEHILRRRSRFFRIAAELIEPVLIVDGSFLALHLKHSALADAEKFRATFRIPESLPTSEHWEKLGPGQVVDIELSSKATEALLNSDATHAPPPRTYERDRPEARLHVKHAGTMFCLQGVIVTKP